MGSSRQIISGILHLVALWFFLKPQLDALCYVGDPLREQRNRSRIKRSTLIYLICGTVAQVIGIFLGTINW